MAISGALRYSPGISAFAKVSHGSYRAYNRNIPFGHAEDFFALNTNYGLPSYDYFVEVLGKLDITSEQLDSVMSSTLLGWAADHPNKKEAVSSEGNVKTLTNFHLTFGNDIWGTLFELNHRTSYMQSIPQRIVSTALSSPAAAARTTNLAGELTAFGASLIVMQSPQVHKAFTSGALPFSEVVFAAARPSINFKHLRYSKNYLQGDNSKELAIIRDLVRDDSAFAWWAWQKNHKSKRGPGTDASEIISDGKFAGMLAHLWSFDIGYDEAAPLANALGYDADMIIKAHEAGVDPSLAHDVFA